MSKTLGLATAQGERGHRRSDRDCLKTNGWKVIKNMHVLTDTLTRPSRCGCALALSRVVDGRNDHLVGSIRQQRLQGHTAAFARSHDLQRGGKRAQCLGRLPVTALTHTPALHGGVLVVSPGTAGLRTASLHGSGSGERKPRKPGCASPSDQPCPREEYFAM